MPSSAKTVLHSVNNGIEIPPFLSTAALQKRYKAKPLMGLAKLMTWVYQNKDIDHIASQLLQRCQNEVYEDSNALMDLNILLQLRGDLPTALALQKEALMLQQSYALPADNKKSPIRLLAFMAAGDILTNTPVEFLALGAGIDLQLLYIDKYGGLPDVIPEHDIAMVGVCELDRNQSVLAAIDKIIKNWSKPILNPPQRILKMTRDLNGIALQHQPGICMPTTVRVQREELAKILDASLNINDIIVGENYPVIIRPIDSHAGKGLEKIDNNDELYDYLMRYNDISHEVFFVSPYVDYADENGLYSKYRIALMNGKPFLAHVAISEHWMVHYLNAGMLESSMKRDYEATEMRNFEKGFALRHKNALALIHQRIGTNYFGIDCAETSNGELLVFEAGTSMVVHDMDSRELFPYKKYQMEKIFTAFRAFIEDGPEPATVKNHPQPTLSDTANILN